MAAKRSKGLAEANGETPHHLGHRQRLRERFMGGGAEALADYELLELLLFHAIPRKDVKPLAKALLACFGGFAEVINAEPARLREVEGVTPAASVLLAGVRAAGLRVARQEVMQKPVIGSWRQLMDYCRASMAFDGAEQLRIFFLNNRHHLIADEVQQRGTVDHTPAYPREVVRRALELRASAVILVHNHPSGDLQPSKADIAMTRSIRDALKAVDIVLHDHVIVAKSGTASLKTQGLL